MVDRPPGRLYERVLKPLLFRMDPEAAHHLAAPVLRSAGVCRAIAGAPVRDPRLAVHLGGFTAASPVGLAPGFDKHGELTRGMSRLGFGHLVVGTVMATPQGDAPTPRVRRLPERRALINCMGLPSHGPEHAADRITRGRSAVPLVVSIGASDIDGFLSAHARLEPLAAAIELNLQCHNEGAGPFEDLARVEELVARIASRKRKALFLKVNAYHGDEERRRRMEMVARTFALGVDGFSALGTSLVEADDRLSLGRGVVTGEPLLPRTLEAIRDIYEVTGDRAIIRARGGISTGEDAFRAIAAGATTVEVFTGFVYQGWGIARRITTELIAAMDREGVPDVATLRGRDG
jgi:dihydroorotate dehydrogenase